MKLPETGSMILDRTTSRVWKVVVSERTYHYEGFDEYENIHVEAVNHDGTWLDLNSDDFNNEPDRYVFLEPMQVLELAKHVTEQAVSCVDKKLQRELCLKAIWLLQWFSED